LTDITSIEAARARIREERARRLAEKIEAGEIISVPIFVVVGSQSEARIRVKEAKASKLAVLHAAGDQREVVFDVTMAVTGVLRPGENADPASVPTAPSFLSSEDRAIRPPPPAPVAAAVAPEVVKEEAREEPLIEAYVCVQTRQCRDDDDAGQIAEGWYSIDGKFVTVTNKAGKYVGSRAILEGEDARVVAKALLREKSPESESFNRRLSYPNAGLA
jgi:hypothetical protein